jgi:uridine phosphorylase
MLTPQNVKNLPKLCILAPTRTIRDSLLSAYAEIQNEKLKQTKTILDCVDIYQSTNFAIISPVIGAPLATAVAETLITSGVRNLILNSIGGALNHANIGDIVFPRGAISEEGTSGLYSADKNISQLSNTFQHQFETSLSKYEELPTNHCGKIWTTDAPFQETPAKINGFKNEGAVLVDMEYSALLHLANIREVELAAAFVVSDNLIEDTQGFRSKDLKTSIEALTKKTIELALTS